MLILLFMTHRSLTSFPTTRAAMASPFTHRILRAYRVAGMAQQGDVNPQTRLVELLGSEEAVSGFRLLLCGMAHVWPDPLTLFRPCCPQMTPDEISLLAMVTHAGQGNRRAFDAAIGEMIGEEARDWLYVTAARLAVAMRG